MRNLNAVDTHYDENLDVDVERHIRVEYFVYEVIFDFHNSYFAEELFVYLYIK